MSIKTPRKYSFVGYLALFFCVSFTTTCSVLLFDALVKKFPGKTFFTAIFLLINVIIISIIYGVIDYVRRKLTVDKPTKLILDATSQITSGNFNVKINPIHAYGMYDEFDIIIENINRMANELSKSEILKSDFIANVSHEIKTPVSIISNYAMLLQNENLPSDTIKDYTQTLLKTSKRLSDLVVNILKLNKLENQRLSEHKSNINVGNKLSECILQFEELLDDKNINLDCDIDDIILNIEDTYLDVIFNNLVSNAIKFSNINGDIKISLKENFNNIVFKISDTGCGMSKETGERIFDKFYQGDTSHTQEGNGLGLALVKKVIDIIGGDIMVESELNVGSTFTVNLRK
ncbi:MAG: HAMP domain-containing histidine kinase [Clostridia bacterium]|nr:HAMP domain-containing histidine kinase [Clostridia bacterium]